MKGFWNLITFSASSVHVGATFMPLVEAKVQEKLTISGSFKMMLDSPCIMWLGVKLSWRFVTSYISMPPLDISEMSPTVPAVGVYVTPLEIEAMPLELLSLT